MIEIGIDKGVATLTLSRAPVNAMNDAWVERFHLLLDQLAGSDQWSVLLIESSLKIFSAGADLEQMRGAFAAAPEVQAEVGRRYQALFSRIEALPQPSIAALNGAALGGGLELALACDFRIAGKDARLGLPEVGLGLIPGAGGTQRLTALCGRATALRMILGTEIIDGEEAHRVGLVQWTVEAGGLLLAARNYAERLATLPAHAAAAAKTCIAAAAASLQPGFDREFEKITELLGSEATKSLIREFLQRQKSPKIRSADQ